MVHHVRTGRGEEIVQVLDVTHCTTCGADLRVPRSAVHGWRQCICAGGDGHVTLYCRACGGWSYDPPCSADDDAVARVNYTGT